ncbi:MAG: Rpp14/Pop5 family protein [Vulcanisaeta sp. AZ3]|jgi:RNase P/RNase MRP subunit POP5|nr:MAG: hypothetical protein TU36_00210 [Vulcanisaeta sp. AZ3]
MRYVIIDIYPRNGIDSITSELNNWFRLFAGREAIGAELRIIKEYRDTGRLVIKVPNNLTKYLRSAIVMVGRDSGISVITVKVTGTMRKALAISSSVPYLFNEFSV